MCAHLLLVVEEELVGIHAIGHGVTDDRKPMKDHRGFVRIFEQELLEYIEHNGNDDEGGNTGSDEDR